MREIKFAWVCLNIKFNEIKRVELTDTMLIKREYPSWITTDNCKVLAKIRPTGLPDCKGKEIYEGDIVKFDKYEWYRSPINTKEMIDKLPDYYETITFDYQGVHPNKYDLENWCEVVGNIYETPELIGKT